MSDNSLEDLPLTSEEREKIGDLGVPSAAALLAMIHAAPGELEQLFGSDRIKELLALLERSLPSKERDALKAIPTRFPITGAVLDRSPRALRPPDYDLEVRDRLFEQLQDLRRKGDASPDTQRRIAQLERSLNALLEGG